MRKETFPKLLIHKGKYSTDYYLLKNIKDKNKASLEIVKHWLDNEYLSKDTELPKTPEEYVCTEMNISLTELKEISLNPLFGKAKAQNGKTLLDQVVLLASYYKDQAEANRAYMDAKKAVSSKNAKLAWQIILDHRDGEYMGVEEETFM